MPKRKRLLKKFKKQPYKRTYRKKRMTSKHQKLMCKTCKKKECKEKEDYIAIEGKCKCKYCGDLMIKIKF